MEFLIEQRIVTRELRSLQPGTGATGCSGLFGLFSSFG
jgi:hypothetical protein